MNSLLAAFFSGIITAEVFFCGVCAFANEVTFTLSVQQDENDAPRTIQGDVTYTAEAEETCFYLPYNNKDFRSYSNLKDRFAMENRTGTPLAPHGGGTRITASTPSADRIENHLYKVRAAIGQQIILSFASNIPRYATDDPNQWFFYEFYPIRLRKCYSEGSDPIAFEWAPLTKNHIHLQTIKGWEVHAPNVAASPQTSHAWTLNAPEFSFVLSKGMKSRSLNIAGLSISLSYKNPAFLKLIPTIKQALDQLTQWSGPLPLQHLWMIEASQFERDDLPGLVLMNRAKQESLQNFQSEWLNWAHWALVTQLTRQWYGGFIKRRSFDDEWLMRGTAEFVSLKILDSFDTRFDFFNLQDGATSWLDMNYREFHDLGLTILYQNDPEATLATPQLDTATPYRKQHAMLPLRHAAALRYLVSRIGKEEAQKQLRAMTSSFYGRSVTPKDFAEALTNGPSPLNTSVHQEFLEWWQTYGWSDFAIRGFRQKKKKDGGYDVRLDVQQEGELKVLPTVTLTTNEGHKEKKTFKDLNKDGHYQLRYTSKSRIIEAVIDEERESYDVDRYNNSTSLPSVKFFPGSAKGIPDDGYTIVWLPYPFRRAGQAWSLALQTGLFRYINSSTTLNIESELSGKHRFGFNLRHYLQYPLLLTNGQLLAEQNIYGSRKIELATSYGPLFPYDPQTSLGLALRHRQVVGQEKSRHITYAIGTDLRPKGQQRYFGYHVQGEYENAPRQNEFSYDRRFVIVELDLFARHYFDYTFRFFRGDINTAGDVAAEFMFRPEEVKEARMRLDQSGVKRTASLYSTGHDVLLPAMLPFGDLGVVTTSHLKWRLFYDYGKDLSHNEELQDAGLGFDAPLGGDLSGVGTFAVSKLSLMTILYSKIDTETSRKPRLLFNIGAEF